MLEDTYYVERKSTSHFAEGSYFNFNSFSIT